MTFDLALRLTELMLALALLQAAMEHLRGTYSERILFGIRAVLCVALLAGVARDFAVWGLMVTGVAALMRFEGPYNGGSDRMGLLILACLSAAHAAPSQDWAELALGYLAVQVTLSYLVSGWVKLVNPEWRRGHALRDVFAFSAYPVSQSLRAMAERPRVLRAASWGVIGFEVLFPLSFLHPLALAGALCITASFHLANAMLFGLNRFFWVWLSAYPVLIWLQGRLVG
ncbi:HTTM domain-containing protein [Roseobacteraceae bacterium S113]